MATDQTRETQPQQQSESTTGLIPLSNEQQQLLRETFGDTALPQLHNFSGSPQEIWRATAKATGPDVMNVDQLKGESFRIRHFFVHGIMLADPRSGKREPAIRSVLIDPDGKQLAVVSSGVAKDLAGIIQTFGMDAYDPPIEVHVVSVPTRSRFTVYRLIPA